jgi:hypothetical protein
MKFLIFIPPKNFRDESIALVKLFFDKYGVRYRITGYNTGECVGTHGAVYVPDLNASKAYLDEYDGIVLIDGEGNDEYKIYDYRPLLDMLLLLNQKKRYIISIGNSAKIPARANIIKDAKIATDDKEAKRLAILFHGVPSDSSYEINSNRIITIRNYGELEESMQRILEHIGA